jgi:protein ImuB
MERGEPVEVVALLPDRPPSWLRWRGEEYVLKNGVGPERIVTEWWKEDQGVGGETEGKTRDYFKVQTEGGSWLWVYREWESGKWFVQGVW